MRILVVGGAGYIGSHMVKSLMRKSCDVTVLDNLSTGHADAVPDGSLVVGDLANVELLDRVLAQGFDIVMHFASSSLVGESMQDPGKYYRNNVACTLNLLEAMVRNGINRFVFSSTAAIFGEPEYVPIDEEHPVRPINPYGRSKWMVELMLEDFDRAHGLKSICLRYFNAAGADPEGELGERHDPETHLIPLVLQAASGRRESITIFGANYDTPDGTCIRDYIHVMDLCEAHWLAIEGLMNACPSTRYNLGNGKGFSVREVIDACKRVTGKEFSVLEGEYREGDPAILVADATRIRKELGWRPKYSAVEEIIEHAWNWEKKLCR